MYGLFSNSGGLRSVLLELGEVARAAPETASEIGLDFDWIGLD